MNNEVETTGKPRVALSGLAKYGMLLMGIFLIILSSGRFVTPSAAFLAPIFLLRFTRNTPLKTGIFILYVLLFLSLLVRLHGYIDVPRPLNLLLVAGITVIEILPFIADRKLFRKLPPLLAPLVLPCTFVVLSFIASAVLPFGSMGEKSYSQIGNSELMQMLSITGTHGITFAIFWFAATMAYVWDSGFVWRRCRGQVMLLTLCTMLVVVSGGFRNIFDENESDTVRMAAVVGNQSMLLGALSNSGVENGVTGLSVSGYATDEVSAAITAHHNDLFLRTKREAQAGAAIVSWAEADGVVFKSAEAELVSKAAAMASELGIYLVATFAVVEDPSKSNSESASQPKDAKLIENKLQVFGPQGALLGQYSKRRTLWNDAFVSSDNDLLLLETEFGKIAFAIGFDLDFPATIRQARDADIIIAPSSDWSTLSPHHSLMATFRGVENGASVFRPTNKGLSIASDSHGRILARTDHFRASPHTMVANVPTRGIATFYSAAGDWFAWANVGLLFILLLVSVWSVRRKTEQLGGAINNREGASPVEARDRSRITAIQWRGSERDNNLDRKD